LVGEGLGSHIGTPVGQEVMIDGIGTGVTSLVGGGLGSGAGTAVGDEVVLDTCG